MDIRDLVKFLLTQDLLRAREYVADARRQHTDWSHLEMPTGLSEVEMCVAAGIVELLASRDRALPPAWTNTVAPHPTCLCWIPASTRCLGHLLMPVPPDQNRFAAETSSPCPIFSTWPELHDHDATRARARPTARKRISRLVARLVPPCPSHRGGARSENARRYKRDCNRRGRHDAGVRTEELPRRTEA